MESRVNRVFEGLSLIAVGLVFLGMTTGVLPWAALWNVLSLWPLLLVVAGIDLVGKSLDNGWVRALSSVVFIAGLAFAVLVMPVDGWPGTLGIDLGARQAVEFDGRSGSSAGLDSAEAVVKAPVGRMSIGRARGGSLVSWEGWSPYGEPAVDVSREGPSAVVTVDTLRGRPGPLFGPTRGVRFDLGLNDAVTWSLKLDAGIGELEADLSDLAVESVEVDSGIGNAVITLGDPQGRGRVSLDSGIASVTIRIPEDAQASVRVRSGIGSRNLPGGFEEAGDGRWETRRYERVRDTWDVTVESGIGELRVETYRP